MERTEIDNVLKELTIEEKVRLLVGRGIPGMFGNPPSHTEDIVGETHPVERLKIPAVKLADGPAGVRIKPRRSGKRLYTTAFPVEVMLASTWNTDLLEEVGKAMGVEALEYGVDILLAPALNIHRNPLGGRNFEYYSEDPVLSGKLAAAFVRGVQSRGVGACLKHFVANNQETNRMGIDTIVSERALREIYLRGFEIALKEGNPWTVMSAYNKLNGEYCSQNRWLLVDVLRGEWKFEGLVMSDWYAGEDPVKQIKNGNDLIMPGKAYQIFKGRRDEIESLLSALKRGDLRIEELDTAVSNVLKIIMKTPSYRKYEPSFNPPVEENAEIARKAGVEGVVLLKNEKALPLAKDSKVAVFGTAQIETVKGGLGSGDTRPKYTINVVQGLKEVGVKLDEELLGEYEEYVERMRGTEEYRIEYEPWWNPKIPHLPQDFLDDEYIERLAYRNDTAIVVIGRISGEGWDRRPQKGDFYLTDDEYNLIKRVSRAFKEFGKRVVVVLNVGGPIEVESWKDMVDSILVLWQAGQETGRILADVISGKVSPSGKLPVTFPKDYRQVPSWMFPGEPPSNPERVIYEEGIYVGYRYYDTFNVEPSFEFGFGLSYTEFSYEDCRVDTSSDGITVRVRVKNVGNSPGKEVVQVYLKHPKVTVDTPLQELKGFAKTSTLNPSQSEELKIRIPYEYVEIFDGSDWKLMGGIYEIRVGSSSRDIRFRKSVKLG